MSLFVLGTLLLLLCNFGLAAASLHLCAAVVRVIIRVQGVIYHLLVWMNVECTAGHYSSTTNDNTSIYI